MTCIVAVGNGNTVFMGGDSAAADESSSFVSTRKEPKVFIKNGYLFGYAGSFRFGKVVQHTFIPPKPDFNDLDKFLNTVFIDSLRKYCDELKVDPSSEQDSSEMLVGIGGRVFEFCNDWHFGEDANNYNAIGQGAQFAMGSLFSTRRSKSPYARIKTALEASSTFSAAVRPPFTILEL